MSAHDHLPSALLPYPLRTYSLETAKLPPTLDPPPVGEEARHQTTGLSIHPTLAWTVSTPYDKPAYVKVNTTPTCGAHIPYNSDRSGQRTSIEGCRVWNLLPILAGHA